jgi:hypothetical protein
MDETRKAVSRAVRIMIRKLTALRVTLAELRQWVGFMSKVLGLTEKAVFREQQ